MFLLASRRLLAALRMWRHRRRIHTSCPGRRLQVEALEQRCVPDASLTLPFAVGLGVTDPYRDVMVADFDGDGRQQVVGRVGTTGNWWSGEYDGDQFDQEVIAQWTPSAVYVDVQQVDLNEDGRADIIGRNYRTGDWLWTHFDGTRYQTDVLGSWEPKQQRSLLVTGDFNGDGQGDIAGFASKTGTWWGLISGPDGYTSTVLGSWQPRDTYKFISAADLDGNGRAEIIAYAARAHSWMGMIYEGGKFNTVTLAQLPPGSDLAAASVADINADGRLEVIAFDRTTSTWSALNAAGTGFVVTPLATWPPGLAVTQMRIADCNGDGLPDVVARQGKTWMCLYFNGNDYGTAILVNARARSYVNVLIGDVSGDELPDVVARDNRGNWWSVNQYRVLGNWRGAMDFVQLADLNNDGKADLFGVSPATGNWWALCSAANGRYYYERLSNWNQEWHYAPKGFVNSDADLAQLIRRQIRGLTWLLSHDRFQAARLITDWTGNRANVSSVIYPIDPGLPAADMYNLFLRRAGGVLCGGMALFNAAVLRLFGFDAFTVDFGDLRYFTHVVSMIRSGGQFYIMDPTYDAVYSWRGRYASVQTLFNLYDRQRLNEVTIKSMPLDMRLMLLRRPDPSPLLDFRERRGSFYIYGAEDYYNLKDWLDTTRFRGYPRGTALMMALLSHSIFNVYPSSDAANSFKGYASSRGIPVG